VLVDEDNGRVTGGRVMMLRSVESEVAAAATITGLFEWNGEK